MSEFFQSEIIQEELSEINRLQEEIYGTLLSFGTMSNAERMENIDKLQTLLNKQQVMYTRLSLSDDPDAVKMRETIVDSATMMGLPKDVDMNTVFNKMSEMIVIMKQQIDKDD